MKLNQKDLAELLGVSTSRVTQLRTAGDIERDSGEMYDLGSSKNREFLERHFYRRYIEKNDPDEDDDTLNSELLREQIRYTRTRRQKVELSNANERRDLVPFQLVRDGFGAFASHMRTNILTVGERVARGDTKLRKRIEEATQAAIEATIRNASAEIERMDINVRAPETDGDEPLSDPLTEGETDE